MVGPAGPPSSFLLNRRHLSHTEDSDIFKDLSPKKQSLNSPRSDDPLKAQESLFVSVLILSCYSVARSPCPYLGAARHLARPHGACLPPASRPGKVMGK